MCTQRLNQTLGQASKIKKRISILQGTKTRRAEGHTSHWQNQNSSPGPSELQFLALLPATHQAARSLGPRGLLAVSARVTPGTGFKDHLGRGLEVMPASTGLADLSLKASIPCVVLGSQAGSGPTPHCRVTLGKSLNLSEPQFKIGLEIPVSKWG